VCVGGSPAGIFGPDKDAPAQGLPKRANGHGPPGNREYQEPPVLSTEARRRAIAAKISQAAAAGAAAAPGADASDCLSVCVYPSVPGSGCGCVLTV
jgi:hypothetical protein